MKDPLPEWGPAEREARRGLNCLRYELEPAVANDVIGLVLAAFAELRAARAPEDGRKEFVCQKCGLRSASPYEVLSVNHACPGSAPAEPPEEETR